MITNKHIDRICVIVMIVALIAAVVFMNGEKLGMTVIRDADSESAETLDSKYNFTDNDQNGSWGESNATKIELSDDGTVISGDGAYLTGNVVTIAESGYYCLSGTLTNGRVIVNANENSKVFVKLKGVSIYCEDNAPFEVAQADKVFLTLDEGSDNYLESGSTYSEEAEADGAGGVIYAHDDLTINGSGNLSITAAYKHGIEANDDLKITGGSIDITAASDAIHVNDLFAMMKADLTIKAADDAVHADDSIYIKSGTIDVTVCYEGLEAKCIDIEGGDINMAPSDDGINASDGSSDTGMMNFGHMGRDSGKSSSSDASTEEGADTEEANKEKPDASSDTASADTESPEEADAAKEAADADQGSRHPGAGMGGHDMGAGPGEGNGEPPTMDMGDGSNPPSSDMGEGGQEPPSDMADIGQGFSADVSGNEQDSSDEESDDEESTSPYVNITGGNITIINTKGTDADGIDSNGDITISGGNVYVSLRGQGTNNAMDWNGENSGKCVIDGGYVIACGSSSMSETPDEGSQPVIMYNPESTLESGTSVTVTDEDGNVCMEFTLDNTASCLTLSCESFKIGETYTITAGDTSEEITLETSVTTAGKEGTRGMGFGR